MGALNYLDYSNRDMKYGQDMLRLENFDPVGRYAKQSVEKRFKHYLTLKDDTILGYLLSSDSLILMYNEMCVLEQIPPNKSLLRGLEILTVYGLYVGYPSDTPIILDFKMAREALEIAELVNRFIDTVLNNQGLTRELLLRGL